MDTVPSDILRRECAEMRVNVESALAKRRSPLEEETVIRRILLIEPPRVSESAIISRFPSYLSIIAFPSMLPCPEMTLVHCLAPSRLNFP